MRILIIKTRSLSDVVQALPAVNLIRRRHPDAYLAWVINDSHASVLHHCPIIDTRIEFKRAVLSKFKNRRERRDFLHYLYWQHFRIVADLQGECWSSRMVRATHAKRRIGLSDARIGARLFYTEVVKVSRVHAVDRYLRVARHLGCEEGPVEFPLGSSEMTKSSVDRLLGSRPGARNWIGVNATASWPTKLWGDERFSTLLRQLPRDRVVLTGSAADAPRIDAIAGGCLNLAGRTDLAELAEIYRRCAVVITNDSGPMHLAAAAGTPVIAIFGATDPALTGPYGKGHVVLQAGISCVPCMKSRCTHRPHMECMDKVTIEQVLAAAQPFLV